MAQDSKVTDGVYGEPTKRTEIDRSQWYVIPGAEEVTRIHDGLLALYVGAAGKRGPRGAYRPGFDWRWSIWHAGTLLGEGFTDCPRAARSAADQEAERVTYRIRDAVKRMDIRAGGASS